MAGLKGRAAKLWFDSMMGLSVAGIFVGLHYGWSWMQDQTDKGKLAPVYKEKDPWIEKAKYLKEDQSAAEAGVATRGEK